MKRALLSRAVAAILFLLLSVTIPAESQGGQAEAPPIGQPLVREGSFAVRLVSELGISTTEDEVEAESLLGSAGIAPRNGWIADYPVTPDIVGEVRQAVSEAADSGRLQIGGADAMRAFENVVAESSLPLRPYREGERCEAAPRCENYPNPGGIDDYYTSEGPPIVTYYAPPPAYYALYAWVPYPFWWTGFWFPGFFVLHDFHKVVVLNRRVTVVTNHFTDVQTHRTFRIDPVGRFNGRTFAGIGASHSRGFISTGIPRSPERVFNRAYRPEGVGKSSRPSTGGGGKVIHPQGGGRPSGGMQGR
ncbi:MAG TPA: hypothetical protein VEI96_03240 [Thermodesulfovibrionales bacterium]|nr:hypothetical protein [Thermodesulfovibrionales bacterium]